MKRLTIAAVLAGIGALVIATFMTVAADVTLIAPANQVAIRCEAATWNIRVPAVDPNGVIVGTVYLSIRSDEQAISQAKRDKLTDACLDIARFRGKIN